MAAYYNEIDPFATQWLRNLIRDGLIPDGEIDERPIQEVSAGEVRGFSQRHWFAGIGGWPYALRLAGWPDDRPVDTGSCPCQPFSCAGSQKGFADDRHLWPHLLRILAECRPPAFFGEQVAGRLGREWLAGVRADLEALGYAVGAADLCAACIGAPHIRQRLFFLAHAPGERLLRQEREDTTRIASGVLGTRFESDWREFHGRRISVEPGAFPVAHGIPSNLGLGEPGFRQVVRGARANQAGRLRGCGNAIVPGLAARFVRAAVEACNDIVGEGAVMSLRLRDEGELRKLGIMIDPSDPSKAIPIGQSADRQASAPAINGSFGSAAEDRPDGRAEPSGETKSASPQSAESFARETSPGPVDDVSGLDDQAFLAGMRQECACFRELDANYPGRYHRLGTYAIESDKRFGEEATRQALRAEGINRTIAYYAREIAQLYTYEQAIRFPSGRAIIRAIPPKQPRNPKSKPVSGADHPTAPPRKPAEAGPAASGENVLERFIELGIRVKELLGDGALDQAIEQIRAHVAETFEEAFVEVTP